MPEPSSSGVRRPSLRPDPSNIVAWIRLASRRRPGRVALAAALALGAFQVNARAEDRAERARRAWGEHETVWVATSPIDAGAVIHPDAVAPRQLPRAALPDDAATSSPVGRRTAVALAAGESIRSARLAGRGPIAAQLADDEGAIGLTVAAPHVVPGDIVDLHSQLTGERVAAGARVLRVDDDVPVVAVAEADLAALVRTFTTGDVVAVVVG